MPQLADRRYQTLFERAATVFRAQPFLVHTYTREARIDQAPDAYGETTSTFDVPVAGNPCQLTTRRLVALDPTGNPVIVVATTMLVPPDDPLKGGDRVSNVVVAYGRQRGTVVEPGPALVMWTRGVQPFGPMGYSEASLERIVGEG
jgi:hypothetical protein